MSLSSHLADHLTAAEDAGLLACVWRGKAASVLCVRCAQQDGLVRHEQSDAAVLLRARCAVRELADASIPRRWRIE